MNDTQKALTDEEYIDKLERENVSLRNAQKACEDCDAPTMERVRELERDGERLEWLIGWFSPMSVDIDGNHAWQWRGNPANLRGPNMRVSIDKCMAK